MMTLAVDRAFDAIEASHRAAEPKSAVLRNNKRQITRNRTSYSCRTCRRRKIKCDKQQPVCGTCTKTNEECVYGKFEPHGSADKEAGNGITTLATKRRWTPPSDDNHSPEALLRPSADFDPGSLDIIENQLRRLTSLVDLMRRDPTSLRVPGLPSPMSGEDGGTPPRNGHKSTDQSRKTFTEGAPSLTQPLSELKIASDKETLLNDVGFGFWKSVVGEVDQLHSMMQGMRPMGPPPHSDHPKNDGAIHSDTPLNHGLRPGHISHNDSLSFHKMVKSAEAHGSNPDCKLCRQLSGDKSTLLPGQQSAELSASLRLDLTADTPTEEQSNVLFRAWLTGVHLVFPFSVFPQAFTKHQAYWEWRRTKREHNENETQSPDIYSMPVLNCIWYAGVLSLSAKGFHTWFPGQTRAQLASLYHSQAIRYLTLVSFPSNLQLPLLGSLIILLTLPVAEEEPLQTSTFVNLVVKLAQSLGIHREPSLFGVAPVDAEMRRRIWWQVVQLDVSFASSSGFPPFIKEDMSDTRAISEVQDLYIGTPDEQSLLQKSRASPDDVDVLPEPLSSTDSIVSVCQLVAKASHSLRLTMRKAINMHMSAKMIDKETLQNINAIINSTQEEVERIIKRIPAKGIPELGFNPDEDSLNHWPPPECDPVVGESLTDAEFAYYYGLPDRPSMSARLAQYHRQKLRAFNRWARISLSLMCDQMYGITYAPFLKNVKSKVWATGRQCALHHCTSFMRKLISLATDPGLESFRWSWPGTHHPMHAAIVMLIDVYERPYSVEAPRSRALIDQLFALADPVNGIVGGENGVSIQRPLREGGSEAWDLIRDLRSTAWRKVGLDPNVIWTVDDQIQVGVAQPLTATQRVMQTLRENSFEPESMLDGHRGAGPPQDSLPAMRAGLDITNKETMDANKPQPQPATISSCPTGMASAPDNASRRLLRLPTQQLMPYPLSGYEKATCNSHAKNPITDQSDREAAAADAIRVANIVRMRKDKERNGSKDYSAAMNNDGAGEASNFIGNGAMATPASSTDGVAGNGYTNMVSQPVAVGQAMEGSANYEMLYQNTAAGEGHVQNGVSQSHDMSDTFDWERWDAVFGQYSGFTDLMEMDGVTWDEKDENHA